MQPPVTWPDRVVALLDETLRALAVRPTPAHPSPAAEMPEPDLEAGARARSGALMRVNHAGEIAAQALYVGQAFTAKGDDVRARLLAAARDERDHLAWCGDRLEALGARPSLLDPLWFGASLCLGAATGLLGDGPSLGFVAETERQVEAHLDDHLRRLPSADTKSAAVLERMAADEARHGADAKLAGGSELPAAARLAMRLGGGFLRRAAYFL